MGKRVAQALRIARLRKDDGGSIDTGYDPFAAETYIHPDIAAQSKFMAGKDVDTLKGVGSAINQTLTLPQRALQNSNFAVNTGTYDPRVPAEAALTLAGGASPFAEKGAAGIFGGRLAATADHAALARAEEMAASGAPREAIHAETGWFQGPDQKWRFEIPDANMTVRQKSIGDLMAANPQTVGSAISHPELFSAYPDLEKMPFSVLTPERVGGAMPGGQPNPWLRGAMYATEEGGTNPSIAIGQHAYVSGTGETPRSILAHELQHGVQNIEGFAGGSSPDAMRGYIADQVSASKDRLDKIGMAREIASRIDRGLSPAEAHADLMSAGANFGLNPETSAGIANDAMSAWTELGSPKAQAVERAANAESRNFKSWQKATPNETYRRVSGEVEARNVQTRLKDQGGFPRATEDTPEKSQIVRFGGSEPQLNASIRAYHGSPHDFDAFSLDKIGTGEGAQSFGHGLYFAENEAVAKGYKENLGVFPEVNKLSFNPDRSPNRSGQVAGDLHAGISREDIAQGLRVREPNASDEQIQAWIKEGQQKLDDVRSTAGKMYEVNINADPEHFLDWDKPLSEQHPQAQAALKQTMGPNWDQFKSAKAGDAVKQGFIAPGEETTASQLNQAGIPGIKYLDQGSRASGEGSRNYVVFNDQLINILRKYGIVGAPAAAMAASIAKGSNDTRMRRGGAVKTALASAKL